MTQQNILARLRRLPGGVFWLLGWLCACAGAVCFAYYWRVFYYLEGRIGALPLTAAMVGLASAATLAVFLLVRFVRQLDTRAAICIFLCGALFCFANPPKRRMKPIISLRSYSLSLGHLDFDASRTYPDDVAKLVESFPGAWVNSHTSQGMTTDEDGNPSVYTTEGYALKQQGEDGPVSGVADGFAAYFDGQPAENPVSEPYFFMTISMARRRWAF